MHHYWNFSVFEHCWKHLAHYKYTAKKKIKDGFILFNAEMLHIISLKLLPTAYEMNDFNVP